MLEKLLNKVKVGDPLVLLIVVLGNLIIVLALVVKLYAQLILPVFQSNNYYLIITTGVLILILASFFSVVELYVGQGIVKRVNHRRQEKAERKLIRNLPPRYKAILRQLTLNPNFTFDDFNPQVSSALSDLERLGFIRCDGIPRTYCVDPAYYAFFRENLGLLNE